MENHVQQKKEKLKPMMDKHGELIGPLTDAYECPVSIEYEYDGMYMVYIILTASLEYLQWITMKASSYIYEESIEIIFFQVVQVQEAGKHGWDF